MPLFICTACGTQYAESAAPPRHCVLCEEERQYVPPRGQTWSTLEALRQSHTNTFREYEPAIIGIGSTPAFAIGQRALLVRTDNGNILWDCIPTLDDATRTMIEGLGGIDAIAISHPHFYTTMVEWARAFTARIHLHAADKQWIMRNDPAIEFWDGEAEPLWDGVTLVRCGGHFAGGTVLHWSGGAGGRGALLSGDIVQLIPNRNYVSFMRSYPNLIPLSGPAVARIGATLEPFSFEAVYGAFFDRVIPRGGKDALKRSIQRYVAIVQGDGTAEQL